MIDVIERGEPVTIAQARLCVRMWLCASVSVCVYVLAEGRQHL